MKVRFSTRGFNKEAGWEYGIVCFNYKHRNEKVIYICFHRKALRISLMKELEGDKE